MYALRCGVGVEVCESEQYLNILHLCLYMRYIELLTAGDEAHNFNMVSTFPLTESSE